MTVDISICMVSYNTCGLLRDCLQALYGQPAACSFEVILADNGSSDGTLPMLAADFPQVRVIQNSTNAGYTAPMNQALQAATGRYLMQLNPDTLPLPGLLDGLLAFMEAHPAAGICTPKVLNRDGSLQKQCRRSAAGPWDAFTYASGLSRLFPRSRAFGGYLLTWLPEDETSPVEAVSGSCMFIRRAVVQQIGWLDEAFFAYQEDADFCFRARAAGSQILYHPAVPIIHYGGQGGPRGHPFRRLHHWHRSYSLHYHKHMAGRHFFLVNWAVYAAIGLKLGLSLLVNALRREKIVGSKKP